VLDATGELLNPSDSPIPLIALAAKNGKKTENVLALLKRLVARAGKEQEVTYHADPKGQLLEMIVTPIIAPGTQQPLGAVIVGVAMSDLGERAMHTFSQRSNTGSKANEEEGISSGLWLDGRLHTETIPASARAEIAEAVGKRVEEAKDEAHFHNINVSLDVDGQRVPYKVLFRVLNPDSPFPPAAQVCLYSMASEVAEVGEIQSRILATGALSLAGALTLILLVTYRLTRPIRALVAGTEAVRRGDFDITVPVTTHDEIGALAASFNEMTAGLKLKQKYQRVLAQVADPKVADQLMKNETALGGEMREVTMLFCDVRGFTSLTSGMAPGEVIDMLNEHMTAMTAIVYEHGGVVDKFVGDMVMALFGAPTTHGLDALRATRCAMRMVEERTRLNSSGKWHFQVGIGIATGRVIAGCMGSEKRLDYTVLGERVNLAARLCSNAAAGQVTIDDVTLAILEETVAAEVLPGLALKGFPSTVTAYRVLKVKG
jgi:class 3 adenylate cyclase